MVTEVLAQSVTLGGYIAIWEVIIFVVFFGFWAWVGQWADKDAPAVNTNRTLWNNIYLASGTLILILWFIVPAPFFVCLLMFLVIWGVVSAVYVMHRNARVPQNQTILTKDHVAWLLSPEGRGKSIHHARLEFISVNDNELPVPHREDPEYHGYLIAEEMLHDMVQRRVSHCRVTPKGETYQIQYVIDGISTVAGEHEKEDAEQALIYLKAVAGLDVMDKRRPQHGSFFTIRMRDNTIGWRIATSGSTRGEQLTLERIEEKSLITMEQLGLNSDQREQVRKAIKKDGGIVLVTGPVKNGVSTSVYSMVDKHDAFIQNIHSLELEFLSEFDNITQTKINAEPGAPSHSRQLQSLLHTDPDVLMLGFIDEPEMAPLLVKTVSENAHKKVYVVLNADSVFEAMVKWMKMVQSPRKVAETLIAVTNQRLVRKLCEECREAYMPDAAMLKKLNLPVDKIKQFYRPPTEVIYDKKGNPILCEKCQGTGYYERTAVFETLFISDALRKLIASGGSLEDIRTQCRKERMLYLQEQALRKVIDGTTSIQEVLRISGKKK
ncbi:MAG: Flp pilus assembly complex ATPase component TadA [Phycisphaerae bacterium]|nr:Flp pilus assembly complex ATPase component TadA [Phycisphaerae bacterium]